MMSCWKWFFKSQSPQKIPSERKKDPKAFPQNRKLLINDQAMEMKTDMSQGSVAGSSGSNAQDPTIDLEDGDKSELMSTIWSRTSTRRIVRRSAWNPKERTRSGDR
eukprot:1186499-Amphidinium_carterae.1